MEIIYGHVALSLLNRRMFVLVFVLTRRSSGGRETVVPARLEFLNYVKQRNLGEREQRNPGWIIRLLTLVTGVCARVCDDDTGGKEDERKKKKRPVFEVGSHLFSLEEI